MKKIILLTIGIVLACTIIQAQTISDEVNSQGVRVISGSLENVRDFKDKIIFHVGLSALVTPDTKNTIYCLGVKVVNPTAYEIEKDMLLLIKNVNDEVITLKAQSNYDATVRDVHEANGYVWSDYSTIALYPISEEDIFKICQGVTKIRQEYKAGTFDKEYKKDKIGTVIKAEYTQIKSALKTEKSITDGF